MVRRDHKQRGPSSSPHTPTDQPNTLCLQAPQLLSFALRTKCEVKERMHICIYQYICTSRLIAANKRRYPPEHRTRAGGGGGRAGSPVVETPPHLASPPLQPEPLEHKRKEREQTNRYINIHLDVPHSCDIEAARTIDPLRTRLHLPAPLHRTCARGQTHGTRAAHVARTRARKKESGRMDRTQMAT